MNADIDAWMARAADLDDRPLPLLFVYGATASGKSTAVESAATARDIAIIDIGSDTDEQQVHAASAIHTVPSLKTKSSWARWNSIVQVTPFYAQIVVIDDADVVLSGSSSHGDDESAGITTDSLISFASHCIPVVIIATDTYAVPALHALKDVTTPLVTRVQLHRPSIDAATAVLAKEFPHIESATIKSLVREFDADIRRTRATLQLHVMEEAKYEPGRLAPHNATVWELTDALLGVNNAYLPTVSFDDGDRQRSMDATNEVQQRLIEPHASMLCHQVATHFRQVLPLDDLDTYQRITETLAVADTMRHDNEMHQFLVLRHVPRLIRQSRVAHDQWKPRDVSYRSTHDPSTRDVDAAHVVALERHRLATLDEYGVLDECPRELTHKKRVKLVTSHEAATWRHTDPDLVDAACSLANLTRARHLWTPAQYTTAFSKLLAGRPAPWTPIAPAKQCK